MCGKETPLDAGFRDYQSALVAAGHLIRSGVPGIYGLGGEFEAIVEGFERYVTRSGSQFKPEVMRFPPLLSRSGYQKTDHLETFPNLMGSVHGFAGGEPEHQELARRKAAGEDWSAMLTGTDLVMAPAACYPLYPTIVGDLPKGGRTVDLRAFVYRREPSQDPARMQVFRQREFVRLGSPDQALAHRDYWIEQGGEMLRALGLDVRRVVANDAFFGRGGRVMAASQREQALKFELVVPIAATGQPTAVVSSNYHLDHFGRAFGIKDSDGAVAHTACVGFGLERITLALMRRHGLDSARWPGEVREILELR